MVNYEAQDKEKNKAIQDESQRKCYPKKSSNQMPYQRIEFEIRKDAHWPPITTISDQPKSNHVYNNNINSSQTKIVENVIDETAEDSLLNKSHNNKEKNYIEMKRIENINTNIDIPDSDTFSKL